jgi:hypothetical protein
MSGFLPMITWYVKFWSLEMPTSREKPTAVNLSAILEGLLEADIKFILVGGLAAVVQGAPVTTMEIEFRGHAIRVLDLKMLIEPKRTSNDLKDKRRLPVLEETLRQLVEE